MAFCSAGLFLADKLSCLVYKIKEISDTLFHLCFKEKEKFVSSQSQSSGGAGATHSPHSDLLTPDAAADPRRSPNLSPDSKSPGDHDKTQDGDKKPSLPISSDWRIFECKTWHLEPTVRLQSWAGKKIEPYGVDYILQKLGFSHAKTTIPKWMQVL